jgi:hypothetical protein
MDLVEQIEGFRDIKKGWDSYRAERPPEESIEKAIRFAMVLADIECEKLCKRVAADPAGGVIFFFKRADGTALKVCFYADDFAYLLVKDWEDQFIVTKYPSSGVGLSVLAEFAAQLMSVE